MSTNLTKINDTAYSEDELMMMSPTQIGAALIDATKTGVRQQEEQKRINEKKLKTWLLPKLFEAAKNGHTSITLDLCPPDYPFSDEMVEYLKQANIDFYHSRRFDERYVITFSWTEQFVKESND